MFDTCFVAIYGQVSRRRRTVLFVVLLMMALALWRVPFIKLDHNIENMLPAGEEVLGNIRFLRQSGSADRVVLSLSLPDFREDPGRLMAAVDKLAVDLPGRWVSEVSTGMPGGGSPAEDWDQIMALIPQMITESRLQRLRLELDSEEIDRRLRGVYRRLLAPGGSMARFLAADPLGIAAGVLQDLQDTTAGFGYRVNVIDRHLLSDDRRHALLILRTPVPVTDGFGARALLAHIDACLQASPENLQAVVVAGHRHTVSNEQVIRADIRRTGMAAAAGFMALLMGVFRDRRACVIFLTPFAAILMAIALSSLFLGTVSYFIVGMSVVIAGIAMDYAVHSYVAKRGAGEKVLPRVARPVAVGACTTAAVFVAFFFSAVPGYSQLALFSILSLFMCLTMALFIMPQWIQTISGTWALWRWSSFRARGRCGQLSILAVWVLCLVWFAAAAAGLEFRQDIERFDGSSEEVLRDQREFHRVWGGETAPAMLVVEGADREAVLRKYEEIAARAGAKIGEENLITLARLWPSRETRSRRVEEWRGFWEQRGDMIRESMAGAQQRYGFSENAFEPFLSGQTAATPATETLDAGIPEYLRERFIIAGEETTWAVSYFDDTEENIRLLSSLREAEGGIGVRLVSRRVLSGAISGAVARETGRLAGIAGALVLIPLFLLLRDTRLVMISLAPVLTAVFALLGVLAFLDMPLTAASLIAAMMIVGLVIDYGVYIVCDEHYHVHADATFSIHLSAITTLIGAGVLLFARHPVMFDIGVALVSGITAGYLCAVAVVPALYRLTDRRAAS